MKLLKNCPRCNIVKSFDEFNNNKSKKDGKASYCKPCHYADVLARAAKNKEKINAHNRLRRAKNPEYFRRYTNLWAKNNSHKKNALLAKRRAAKLNATPKWLSKIQLDEINNFYRRAKDLSLSLRTQFEVDHIIPLAGKNVCGLHAPWNLQILEATENQRKGNRF